MRKARVNVKQMSVYCLVAGALSLGTSCQFSAPTGEVKESKTNDFGWDKDLTLDPPASGTAPDPGLGPTGSQFRSDFCRGKAPGECFTLILRVPTGDVVKDLGLSAFAMASRTSAFHIRNEEACTTAFNDYKKTYEKSPFNPKRRMWVNKVKDFQCVFAFFSKEYLREEANLPRGQLGASVRMTGFNIEGASTSGEIHTFKVGVESTKVKVSYRTAFYFGQGSKWQSAKGMGVSPRVAVKSLGREFSWQIDPPKVSEALDQIDLSSISTETDDATKSFFTGAKDLVTETLSAKTPFGPALALVGVGYQAWSEICGKNKQKCYISRKHSDKTVDLAASAQEIAPTSQANELFRLAIIKGVQATLDSLFENSPGEELTEVYGLEPK